MRSGNVWWVRSFMDGWKDGGEAEERLLSENSHQEEISHRLSEVNDNVCDQKTEKKIALFACQIWHCRLSITSNNFKPAVNDLNLLCTL